MKKKLIVIMIAIMMLCAFSTCAFATAVPIVLTANNNILDRLEPPGLRNTSAIQGENAVITFSDDADWRENVERVTINGVETSKYSLSRGKLNIKSSAIPKHGLYVVIVEAAGYRPASASITVTSLATPPTLRAANDDNVAEETVTLTYVDDADWRDQVEAIYVDGTKIKADYYTLAKGKLTIDGKFFPRAGTYEVIVEAEGYQDASVDQRVEAKIYYTVSFNSQGGSFIAAQTIKEGAKASRPTDPQRAGYTFGGWYQDIAALNLFDFNSPIATDQTLYAKWNLNQTTSPPVMGAITINLYLYKTAYTINGQNRVLDTAPTLYKYGGVNYTIVPLRFVAEALGATVNWNSANRMVTIITEGVAIPLQLNVIQPSRGLDCPAIIKNKRTMVPLRYVATSLNCSVNYTSLTSPIIITSI